jgi:hypothetical protein
MNPSSWLYAILTRALHQIWALSRYLPSLAPAPSTEEMEEKEKWLQNSETVIERCLFQSGTAVLNMMKRPSISPTRTDITAM